MADAEKSRKRLPGGKKLIIVLLAFLLIIISLITAIFLLYRSNQLPFIDNEPSEEAEAQELVAKVGKLIILPTETPQIATVSDINQLQDQTIFRNAENGDKVLIFGEAKKAIVYRPSRNIIVEVGSLVLSPDSTISAELNSEGAQEEEEIPVSVVVLNGTNTAGLASRVGNQLSSAFTNIEVEDTGNATESYTKTIVVDVSGNNADLAEQIATELDGEVDDLPEDEDDQGAQILIILGQ